MYITYVVESQVILRSQVTDILSEKILLRCSVLRTGHSCRSYHSETYKDCNCKPFVHVHNGRYCAGLRLPIHRMHTWKFPMHRHGTASFPYDVPAILHDAVHRSFATDESFPGIFFHGSFLWNPDVRIRYSPHCIRQRHPSMLLLSEWITAGSLPGSSDKHNDSSFLPADTSASG